MAQSVDESLWLKVDNCSHETLSLKDFMQHPCFNNVFIDFFRDCPLYAIPTSKDVILLQIDKNIIKPNFETARKFLKSPKESIKGCALPDPSLAIFTPQIVHPEVIEALNMTPLPHYHNLWAAEKDGFNYFGWDHDCKMYLLKLPSALYTSN
jgi:hypothetical protein